jgi:DNA primase
MLSDATIQQAQTAHPLLSYIERDAGGVYRYKASTGGGEYMGACPFCGGKDRFLIWPEGDPPGFWCRQCNAKGDLISYVQRRTGLTFRDAVVELTGGVLTDGPRPAPPPPVAPDEAGPPASAWRERAQAFCNAAYDTLWSPAGARARAQLRERYGLTERTIEQAGLGLHLEARQDWRADWGLVAVTRRNPDGSTFDDDQLFLPAGLVIPWEVTGQTWRIFVRREHRDPKKKYYQVPGGSNCLYRPDGLHHRVPALMCEGALDALAVFQEAGDLVTAVASGTTGARRVRWALRLAACPLVLLAHDNDAGGDSPVTYWSGMLTNAVAWAPTFDDPAAMLRDGLDVRGWVQAGLEYGAAELAKRRAA